MNESQFKPITNMTDLQAVFKTAAKNHIPVLLDFSAKWCTACVELERSVFKDDDVKSTMKKFIVLRLDLSTMNPESVELARQFNIAGPPMAIFFDDHGKVIDTRPIGNMDAKAFKALLETELTATQ